MSLRAKIRNLRNGVFPIRKGAAARCGGHPSEPFPTFVKEHVVKVRKPKEEKPHDPRSIAERIAADADQAEGMPAMRRRWLRWCERKLIQQQRSKAS